jgi:hypothetical protein
MTLFCSKNRYFFLKEKYYLIYFLDIIKKKEKYFVFLPSAEALKEKKIGIFFSDFF